METRWRRLIDAGIAVTSELTLDGVLQRIVETAAELTAARYAALGVIDRSGVALERFLTTGIDPETHERIGDLPRGRGILGVLIRDAQPLRLHDLTADPRAVGFPPHHPLMRIFLGVPILLRGVAYGNLYLTEKDGRRATSPPRTRRSSRCSPRRPPSRSRTPACTSRRRAGCAARVADRGRQRPRGRDRARPAARADRRAAARADRRRARPDHAAGRRAATSGSRRRSARRPRAWSGSFLSRSGSKSGRVLERRRSERVDSTLEDTEVDQEVARRIGMRSGLFVPMVVGDRAIGVIAAHNKLGADPRFTDEDLRIAETFAARAAVAVDLSDRVARDALRRVVEGQELERQRLARELHDETGQALTSILLGLKRVEDAKSRRGRTQAAAASCASRSSRPSKPSAGSRSSCGRRRSTTSGSSPRSSGSRRRSAEQTRDRDRRRGEPRRGRLPAGGRDRALPDRAGGADERRQARRRDAREHRRDPARRVGDGRRRGRRPGLRCRRRRRRRTRARRDEGAGRPARR